jgi:hypothetical protein
MVLPLALPLIGVVGLGFPIWEIVFGVVLDVPMAAILGLQQHFFSKFRITTNEGQCLRKLFYLLRNGY